MRLYALAGVAFALALNSACGGSSTPSAQWSAGGTTALRGTLTGTSSTSGTIDMTAGATYAVAPAAGTALMRGERSAEAGVGAVTITGSAHVGTAVVTLHGTFDTNNPTAAGALAVQGDVTGQPNAYTFTGAAAGNPVSRIEGTFTGPAGRTGKFSVLFVPKAGGTVTVYCGTFTGLATGKWNLVVSSDGPASGSFTSSTGTSGNLSGAVSGGNVSLTWGAGTSASGPISGTSAGGATALWNDGTGGSGSWSGSSTGC